MKGKKRQKWINKKMIDPPVFHKNLKLQSDRRVDVERERDAPNPLSDGLVSYATAVVIVCLCVCDSLMAYSSMNLQ